MAESESTILDLDELMNTKMDDVVAKPDFVTPPAGDYRLKIEACKIEKYETKGDPAKGEKPEKRNRIRLTYAVLVTYAVNAGEIPVADGSLFSRTFNGTQDGIEYFKTAAMKILNVSSFEGATIKDVIDNLPDAEFDARITVTTTKDTSTGKVYENVNVNPVVLPPSA